jgi:uncharacterized protein with beta-barrel porin domain
VASGSISTTGNLAPGIVAQSIGGGGGFATSQGFGGTTTVSLGATGGASGNGGAVKVKSLAAISTSGTDSHGIVAQSIGGGGGLFLGLDASGNPLATTVALNGGSGSAGKVTVDADGAITTTGLDAVGIVAQSIGGGGGLVGGGVFNTAAGAGPFVGTAGGSGAGAEVVVNAKADVEALGTDSTGILAQSAGSSTSDIAVTVARGKIVSGGTGNGHAVSLYNGLRNRLVNMGTLTDEPLLSFEPQNPLLGQSPAVNAILNVGIEEFVITGTSGDDLITNAGFVYGNVNLELGGPFADTNSFTNDAGAYFAPGNTVVIGDASNAGNLLSNSGTISPGDFYNVLTTDVTGNFVQTATGTYLTDLDLNPNTADRINISGTGALSGTVELSFNNTGWAKPGNYDLVIVDASGGLGGTTFTTLASPPSAVFTPKLTYPNADDADLAYNINFSPAGLTANEHSVGNAINGIQTAGVPAFRIVAAELFFIPTVPLLGETYDSLSGEGVSSSEQVIFQSRSQFFDTVMANSSVVVGAGSGPFAAASQSRAPFEVNRWRAWISGYGGDTRLNGREGLGSSTAKDEDYGGSAGIDYRVDTNAVVGFAASMGEHTYNVPERHTYGSGFGGNVGVYGMALFPCDAYLSGVLSFGYTGSKENRYDIGVGLQATHPWTYINQPLTPIAEETAYGKFPVRSFGGQFETGWRYVWEGTNLTPFLNLQFDNESISSFREHAYDPVLKAPGILGLAFASQSVWSVPLSLGVQADRTFVTSDGGTVITPALRLAWSHEFEPQRPVDPSFEIAPGFSFKTYGAAPSRDALQLKAGFTVNVAPDISVYANVSGNVADHSLFVGGTGGFRVTF